MKYAHNLPPESPLFILCQADVPRSVRWLIENGADTRYRNGDGFNCLHMAVSGNSPKTIDALLETEGASEMLQEQMCEGCTPMEFNYLLAEKTNTPINHYIVEMLRKAAWKYSVKQELEAEGLGFLLFGSDINKCKSRVVATDRPIADNLAAAEEEEDEEELWRQYMTEQGQQGYENWRQFMAAQGRGEEHLTFEHYRRFW